jgi:hypothetical protein
MAARGGTWPSTMKELEAIGGSGGRHNEFLTECSRPGQSVPSSENRSQLVRRLRILRDLNDACASAAMRAVRSPPQGVAGIEARYPKSDAARDDHPPNRAPPRRQAHPAFPRLHHDRLR